MILLETFASLKQFFASPKSNVDNAIYKLHYRVTVGLLYGCCALVSLSQFIGQPIHCVANSDTKPYSEKFLNTFCWIQSTFSIESAWNKTIGTEIPYPGVDKTSPNEKRIFHAYYQWVAFVLFIQALFFNVPHLIWKNKERGLIRNLAKNLNTDEYFDREIDRHQAIVDLFEYLNKSSETNHTTMFFWFVATEIMNFVNVLSQMILMDKFLSNQFISYGFEILSKSQEEWSTRIDPMVRLFPRVTKCTFRMYGESGDLERHDTICILPINIVNEKIYIVLWFWFFFLCFLSSLNLIYRLMIVILSNLRTYTIKRQCIHDDNLMKFERLHSIVSRMSLGKWFLLSLLIKNIDPINAIEILRLYEKHQLRCLEHEMTTRNGERYLQSKIDALESVNNENYPFDRAININHTDRNHYNGKNEK